MCKDPVEDIRQAKARLVAIFGDLETYGNSNMEFVIRRQEKRMKRGVKYVDFCPTRNKKPEMPIS